MELISEPSADDSLAAYPYDKFLIFNLGLNYLVRAVKCGKVIIAECINQTMGYCTDIRQARPHTGSACILTSELKIYWTCTYYQQLILLLQTINFFNLGSKLCLVDLPGYGFAYAKEEVKEAWEELVSILISTRTLLFLPHLSPSLLSILGNKYAKLGRFLFLNTLYVIKILDFVSTLLYLLLFVHAPFCSFYR